MGRKRQPLTAKQELFIRMSARDESRTDIFREVFGADITKLSDREIHNIDSTMTRWRKLPEFPVIWREEVDRVLLKHAGKAVHVISSLMNKDDQPWLQLQAANSLLSYSKSRIYVGEENTVNVKIEGMPELGTPDDAEADDVKSGSADQQDQQK